MTAAPVDREHLEPLLARHLGAGRRVEDLRRLSGGASRETWSFEAVDGDGSRLPLILRRDPPHGAAMGIQVDECELIDAAGRAGVPVPTVRFRLGPDDGLGVGFVSDFVEGETLGRHIVHDEQYAAARAGLSGECGRMLAALHTIDPESTSLSPVPPGRSSATGQLDLFRGLLDGYEVERPVLELAMRWLREKDPDDGRRVVVHGDLRVGNLIVGHEGVRALLDWELAHVGDPAEDVGWLCVRSWRFGGPGRVGGCGELDDLLVAYAEAGGEPIDPERVRYWEVFGNLRWAVIATLQTFTHLQGLRRSVELAAIGRRVAEAEYDLMELLA